MLFDVSDLESNMEYTATVKAVTRTDRESEVISVTFATSKIQWNMIPIYSVYPVKPAYSGAALARDTHD